MPPHKGRASPEHGCAAGPPGRGHRAESDATAPALLAAVDALTDAAQFIDAVKQDALFDGWWSEWEGQMREKITKALRAAHGAIQISYSTFVEDALTPKPHWKEQRFEYYAAHFLVGCGLTAGNLDGHVRALADAMQKQYSTGVEHGRKLEREGYDSPAPAPLPDPKWLADRLEGKDPRALILDDGDITVIVKALRRTDPEGVQTK